MLVLSAVTSGWSGCTNYIGPGAKWGSEREQKRKAKKNRPTELLQNVIYEIFTGDIFKIASKTRYASSPSI